MANRMFLVIVIAAAACGDTSAEGLQRTAGPWRVQPGVTWGKLGHAGNTGYVAVRHRRLPEQEFILRMPEYANLYESLPLLPAQWEWTAENSLRVAWTPSKEVAEQHQIAHRATFRFEADFIEIVATVRNPTRRSWTSERYDMYDVMTRNASLFRDDRDGSRTYVIQGDAFRPVNQFPLTNLQTTLTGSLSLAADPMNPGPLEITERLMAKISRDRRWVLGLASDSAAGVSFNLNPGTGCVHQNPHWGRLAPGEKRRIRLRFYLISGELDALEARYRGDFPAEPDPLAPLWRTNLGVDSPTNVIAGRAAGQTILAVQGKNAAGQGASVEAYDIQGNALWQATAGVGTNVGAYLQWIEAGKSGSPLIAFSTVNTENKDEPGTVRFVRADDGRLVRKVNNVTHFGNNNSVVADLDGDGRQEFLYADLSTLTCYELPGFKRRWRYDQGVRFCWSLPALIDTDQDGRAEIVFGSEYNDAGDKSSLLAISADGKPVWRSDGHAEDLGSTPVFQADVDGDGQREILKVGLDLEHRRNQQWNHLHVFAADGKLLHTCQLGFTGIAIGDLDGDQQLEGVGLTNTRDGGRNGLREIRCVDLATGELQWSTPVARAYLDTNSPVMADFDGDGRLEAVVGTGNPAAYGRLPDSEPWGDLYVVNDSGEIEQHLPLAGWPVNLAFCDVTRNGFAELLVVLDGKPGSLAAFRTRAKMERRTWPTPFGTPGRDGTMAR